MKILISDSAKSEINKSQVRQFATFTLEGRVYALDVMVVQEVTKEMNMTPVKRGPDYVKGLINLRGQISTAIGLSELFGLKKLNDSPRMSVVCRKDDTLLSLLVDSIGDVVEVEDSMWEAPPLTLNSDLRNFISGVFKTQNQILSVVSLDNIMNEFEKLNVA